MLKVQNFLEELQSYICAAFGYTAGTDCLLGRIFELTDIVTTPSLTIYEEGGEWISGRQWKQRRNIRFVFRDKKQIDALNRALAFCEWLDKNRRITTDSFETRFALVFRVPGPVPSGRNGFFIADCVIQFLVTG